MPSVLLISESDVGFHKKLTNRTIKSLDKAGFTVVGDCVKPEFTVEAWIDCFKKAELYKIDHIHIDRLIKPEVLWLAIRRFPRLIPPTSFLLGGISEQLRRREARFALDNLEGYPRISKIFVMSIHNRSLKDFCKRISFLQDKKVVYMDQPLYDTKYNYRKVTKGAARMALNLPKDAKIALYFGTYWFSRGPDLLLEVAKKTPNVMFCFVGDTKLQSIKIDPKDYKKCPNIRFDDKYVSEARARHWMRACDVVVLPYRRFYEHDSSGVFDQAMLAERPVMFPNFSPFYDIHHKFNIGHGFYPEDVEDMKTCVLQCFDWMGEIKDRAYFDKYLKQKGSWNIIGASL